MPQIVPPRIYCIPAVRSSIVAVFRRGPSRWAHVGRWDVEKRTYEPGAWFHGRIFPRRSDLSPDGRFLCHFAHKPNAAWEHGETYVAISRLPWLTALYAFPTCGTWTRGYHFTGEKRAGKRNELNLPIPFGLCATPAVQFATELRRGWTEAPDSPKRHPKDAWDERRNARIQKQQPAGTGLLCAESLGWPGGEFGEPQAVDGLRVQYWLEMDGDIHLLNEVQWADWSAKGELLVATRAGKLQIWQMDRFKRKVIFEEDLSTLEPVPSPAPAWAKHW